MDKPKGAVRAAVEVAVEVVVDFAAEVVVEGDVVDGMEVEHMVELEALGLATSLSSVGQQLTGYRLWCVE